MELDISEDQELLQETTASFLRSECPIERVRELADTSAGFERDWWSKGADLGWTSLLVPESEGGGSIGPSGLVDLTLVAREFGRGVAPGPLVPVNVVASALARAGSADQKRRLLPDLLSGNAIASWCFAEPDPYAELGRIETRAAPDGDGWRLTGSKFPVEAAAEADFFLVTSLADTGPMQFLVPADSAGVRVEPARALDLVRRFAEVRFDSVHLSGDCVLGGTGDVADQIEHQLQTALIVQLAETVGAARQVFDFSLEWVGERYSFGRPLSSYQEIKHRFADMKLWLEACHAIADEAAWSVAEQADDSERVVSAAKAYVGEFATELIQDCVQMHGGIGVTSEHDIHLYLRRAAQNRALYGHPREHRARIAARLAAARRR